MIYIIGAGPVGSYTAYLLAKAGHKVTVFEQRPKIGVPVQCTGLLTESINKILKLDKEAVVNKISKARIYNNNNSFETRLSEIIVDRTKFDRWLAKKAQKAGAKILLNHQFMGISNNKLIIKNLKNKTTKKIKLDKDDCLIGADGPDSSVRKHVDKKHEIRHLVGVQARAKLSNQGDIFDVFMDKAPGFFAWIVPENKSIVRIGLAAKEKPNQYFKEFLKSNKITGKQIVKLQGGLIPVYNSKLKVQKGNIYLVGDAASHVKATTGGGIIPGLVAAQCLSLSILYNLNYTRLLRKKVKRKLWLHLKLRKMIDRLSDKDINNLLRLCNQNKVKRILKNTDRDNPVKLLVSLALKEPRFLLFALKTTTLQKFKFIKNP